MSTFDSPLLAEGDVTLIRAYIQANIANYLLYLRAASADQSVSTEPPASYFIYPKAQGYRLPAVFIIHDDMDFRVQEQKANFISAKSSLSVSVLVEDKDLDFLTLKAFRYQSALHALLDQANIVSDDGKIKLVVIVYRHTFTPHWTDDSGDGGQFRKEVVLECQVEHLENF